jgi:hypothetical protein
MLPNKLYKRREASRSIRKVLILCEGIETEPNYFASFSIKDKLIEVQVEGAGRGKDSLVELAINKKIKAERKKESFAVVWCVFDRDSKPSDIKDSHKFNRAIDLARSSQIKVAYSNDSFEIWYILHYKFLTSAWTRDRYSKELSNLLGEKYAKNDENMYNKLLDKQKTAIKNAKKLMENYKPHNPEKDNPCTTVFRLVEFLNEYTR